MFLKILIASLMFVATQSAAQELICKGNEKIIEPCYETRGRVSVWNGAPSVRMWKVGTNRIIGIASGYDEVLMAPDNLNELIKVDQYVFGDFLVCPFTNEKEGWMQIVCVESANNLRTEPIK